MIWTHCYDLMLKIGVLILSLVILNGISFFEGHAILVVLLSLIFSLVVYIVFLRTLGSYLYCRITLKMPITLKQAKNLNGALAPNPFQYGDFHWLPLNEIKHIEQFNKYETAVVLLEEWTKRRQDKWEKMKENTTGLVKFIEILCAVLFILMLVASHFNLPPAQYFIHLYLKLFDTNEYSPMLIGSLVSLLFILPLIWIKMLIQKK